MKRIKEFFKNQLEYLLVGIVALFSITVFVFVVSWIIGNVENFGEKFFNLFLPPKFVFPGIGLLFVILIIYVAGIIIDRTVIKKLFFGNNQGKIITLNRLLKIKPCLFLLSSTCISYGWILSEENISINNGKATDTLINVYYANVPTLISGQVYAARKETVILLGNSSKEIIDLLLYSMRSPKSLKYLPWKDESPADFEKRAKSFGLNIISTGQS